MIALLCQDSIIASGEFTVGRKLYTWPVSSPSLRKDCLFGEKREYHVSSKLL